MMTMIKRWREESVQSIVPRDNGSDRIQKGEATLGQAE